MNRNGNDTKIKLFLFVDQVRNIKVHCESWRNTMMIIFPQQALSKCHQPH